MARSLIYSMLESGQFSRAALHSATVGLVTFSLLISIFSGVAIELIDRFWVIKSLEAISLCDMGRNEQF